MTEATRVLPMSAEVGCRLVALPVHERPLSALTWLSGDFPIAVMVDEILRGPKDTCRVAAACGAGVFSLKLAQSGGIGVSTRVAAIAEVAGIGLCGGTMIEAGLATAAAARLCATLPALAWGAVLFRPLLFTEE